MPERIQRARAKGWRKPAGAVYVGRPTKWGNPYRVGGVFYDRLGDDPTITPEKAVQLYRRMCDFRTGSTEDSPRVAEELRGKDLACWCPLDEACHADVLLEWANGPHPPAPSPDAAGEGEQ